MSDIIEVVYDMSFSLGLRWKEVPEIVRDNLMDHLHGSRGLFDWVMDEATRFEDMWADLDEDDPRFENYYEVIDEWFTKAFDKLVLEGYNYTGGRGGYATSNVR